MLAPHEIAEIVSSCLDSIDDYCSVHGFPSPTDSYQSGSDVYIEFTDGSILVVKNSG